MYALNKSTLKHVVKGRFLILKKLKVNFFKWMSIALHLFWFFFVYGDVIISNSDISNFYNIYIYIHIYTYTNLPVNALVRLPHPQSGDSQGQETFLAPSADKKTRNYDTECSNHHPSLSTQRPKGLSRSKMNWWAIYIQIYQWMS